MAPFTMYIFVSIRKPAKLERLFSSPFSLNLRLSPQVMWDWLLGFGVAIFGLIKFKNALLFLSWLCEGLVLVVEI